MLIGSGNLSFMLCVRTLKKNKISEKRVYITHANSANFLVHMKKQNPTHFKTTNNPALSLIRGFDDFVFIFANINLKKVSKLQ